MPPPLEDEDGAEGTPEESQVEEPVVEKETWQQFIEELQAEGVTAKDAAAYIKDQQSQAYNAAYFQLASDWDVSPKEVERRMKLIVQEFNKLPEDQRAQYDNLPGTKKLWSQLEAGLKSSRTMSSTSKTGTTSSPTPKYLYTQSQIESMSEEEYAKHDKRIQWAAANEKINYNA